MSKGVSVQQWALLAAIQDGPKTISQLVGLTGAVDHSREVSVRRAVSSLARRGLVACAGFSPKRYATPEIAQRFENERAKMISELEAAKRRAAVRLSVAVR